MQKFTDMDAKARAKWLDDFVGTNMVANVHGKPFQVQIADLPIESMMVILAKGWQRAINDHANSAGKDADTAGKHKAAQEKVDAYLRGEITMRGASDGLTAVQREALRLATNAAKKAEKPETWKAMDKRAAGEALLDKNADHFTALAEKTLAAKATLREIEAGAVSGIEADTSNM